MNSVQIKALAATSFGLLMLAVYNFGPLIRGAPIATGFAAKMLCSSMFISGRAQQDVLDNELQSIVDMGVTVSSNSQNRSATASILGGLERTAVFRDGLGCTLAIEKDMAQLHAEANDIDTEIKAALAIRPAKPLPESSPSDSNQLKAMNAALDKAFANTDSTGPRNTRGVVVLQQGKIIAERYAAGFTAATPQLGWSMTKSVNSALIGILVKQGKLDKDALAPVPEWRDAADPRNAITLDQLLRMSSGLEFEEVYESDPASDVNTMLFASSEAAVVAANKPLAATPDTLWSYSSGTSNILSRIVRQAVGEQGDYWSFPHRELFSRIGTGQIYIEPDPAGTFVASSFMYASARDWARLGLLYLNDGVWEGQRILPEGWVDYSRTATPLEPVGRYGAQFWLNKGEQQWVPGLPEDLFAMSGHNGQFVFIIPSYDLVVVRLGFSPGIPVTESMAFVADLLAVLPKVKSS